MSQEKVKKGKKGRRKEYSLRSRLVRKDKDGKMMESVDDEPRGDQQAVASKSSRSSASPLGARGEDDPHAQADLRNTIRELSVQLNSKLDSFKKDISDQLNSKLDSFKKDIADIKKSVRIMKLQFKIILTELWSWRRKESRKYRGRLKE